MTTLASPPYLWNWLKTGEVQVLHSFADHCCCFFIAYLATSVTPSFFLHVLSITKLQRPHHRLNTLSVFYLAPNGMDVSTHCSRIEARHSITNSHHIAYILLLSLVVIPRGYSSLFALCCILELPTFLLAAGSLDSRFRNDYVSASFPLSLPH